MVKSRNDSRLRCRECGAGSATWTGRCPTCGSWNAWEESSELGRVDVVAEPTPMHELSASAVAGITSGIAELDDTLDGGFPGGAVVLFGGEPGAGKSTLCLQAASRVAQGGAPVLYVSAEESPAAVRRRAERLGPIESGVAVLGTDDVAAIAATIERSRPAFVVVDSVHALVDAEQSGHPGSPGQVRAAGTRLVTAARRSGAAVVLIGHVTKDGGLAGPKVLEHAVDVVCRFEVGTEPSLRTLRITKHRLGTTGRMGLFRMTGEGLEPVADPSALLLADRPDGSVGSVVCPSVRGGRPVLVDVQALVGRGRSGGRRTVTGVAPRRVDLVLAVLSRHAGLSLADAEVFVNVAGGLVADEPAVDLAVAAALVSAATEQPIPERWVVFGEVGLSGRVRSVSHDELRIDEAARHGFVTAVSAASAVRSNGHADLRPSAMAGHPKQLAGRRVGRDLVGGIDPAGARIGSGRSATMASRCDSPTRNLLRHDAVDVADALGLLRLGRRRADAA